MRDREQLDELVAGAARLDPEALRGFLDRLDGLMVAIEGYANPELALDVLLLAWPRSSALAASPDARTTALRVAPPAAS